MTIAALRLWIETPMAHALGRALVHFSWEGAAVAGVLALALRAARSSRVRYGLAATALAALPVVFGVTLASTARALPPERLAAEGSARYPVAVSALANMAGAQAAGPDRISWLALFWFAGVLFCYARSVAGWTAAQRLRTRGVCAAPLEWQHRLETLAAQLRLSRPVALLESCVVAAPATIGWFRPLILTPVGFFSGLTAAQVEAILLHELAHIRRYDYAVNLLQTAVEDLLFYHPAVWWISRVVRVERENCCDDVVARRSDARAYAAALAWLEHNRSKTCGPALAANGGDLMKRIRRLTGQPERPRTAAAPAFAMGLLLATVAAAVAWGPAPQNQNPRARALPASGQANAAASPYNQWLNADVAYIITDEERARFRSLQSDGERERFIEEFWKRRDPTPNTAANEFKEEHYRRMAYANEHFASQSLAGWKTDRGRIYIVYGPPDELEVHPADAAAAPYQSWRYRHIQDVGENVIVEFRDSNRDGSYAMTKDPAVPAGSRNSVQVSVGPKGSVTFSAPFDLAAGAYTGTWEISRKGEDQVLLRGQLDARFGSRTVTLNPGSYRLQLRLHDPNGKPAVADAEFVVR